MATKFDKTLKTNTVCNKRDLNTFLLTLLSDQNDCPHFNCFAFFFLEYWQCGCCPEGPHSIKHQRLLLFSVGLLSGCGHRSDGFRWRQWWTHQPSRHSGNGSLGQTPMAQSTHLHGCPIFRGLRRICSCHGSISGWVILVVFEQC